MTCPSAACRCAPLVADLAEAKRLWVHPDARGFGLARRLMAELEQQARALGYRRLNLDSHTALAPAIALYRSMGYADCAAYTAAPANIWMSKPL